MEFVTVNTGKKRQMVFLPNVNANSFLLFFEKGDSGYSWSLRDYSGKDGVLERYSREFGWSAAEVRQKARYMFDAPTVDTKVFTFWHDYTAAGNKLFLSSEDQVQRSDQAQAESVASHISIVVPSIVQFPVLKEAALRTLPKAAKRQDLERIFCSPDSEDWVTWNALNLMLIAHPADWWERIVTAARHANPLLELSPTENDNAHLEFWSRVQSPTSYEQASRMRMRQSGNPRLAARSFDPKKVEGESEIDLTIATERHLVFIEAKLGSDVSMRTTYDPARNQIVRNIDCVLQASGGRQPYFWMLVRDEGMGRAYCQLISQYKEDPGRLARELPHRDGDVLRQLARDIAIIRWCDLLALDLEAAEVDSAELCEIKAELKRRIIS